MSFINTYGYAFGSSNVEKNVNPGWELTNAARAFSYMPLFGGIDTTVIAVKGFQAHNKENPKISRQELIGMVCRAALAWVAPFGIGLAPLDIAASIIRSNSKTEPKFELSLPEETSNFRKEVSNKQNVRLSDTYINMSEKDSDNYARRIAALGVL